MLIHFFSEGLQRYRNEAPFELIPPTTEYSYNGNERHHHRSWPFGHCHGPQAKVRAWLSGFHDIREIGRRWRYMENEHVPRLVSTVSEFAHTQY